MNDTDTDDEIEIRGKPPNNLAYTNGQTIRWFGSGILNKPISNFTAGTYSVLGWGHVLGAPYFAERRAWTLQISVHTHVIPEPAEYALVFGLFALGFFVFRRRFQKKGGISA